MKQATLIYEPTLDAYSLKFDYDKPTHDFLKKVIPAHERTTSGPPTWTWYFGRKYYDVVRTLLESGHKFKLTIVSEDEVRKLQEEQSRVRDTWQPTTQQYSLDEELRKFYALVPHNGTSYDEVRNMSRSDAQKLYRRGAFVYHPDRNNGSTSAATQMSELNRVWNLLKEVYYTK